MTNKVKICVLAIFLVLAGGIAFDLIGSSLHTKIAEIGETEENKNTKLPKISFVNNPVYTVCTDESQVESYSSIYMMAVAQCKDFKGNDIRDEKHIRYNQEIDFMKAGSYTVTYTVKDDLGHTIQKDCVITLTDAIDTGH